MSTSSKNKNDNKYGREKSIVKLKTARSRNESIRDSFKVSQWLLKFKDIHTKSCSKFILLFFIPNVNVGSSLFSSS